MAMARTELAFASFEEGIDLELLALEEEQELALAAVMAVASEAATAAELAAVVLAVELVVVLAVATAGSYPPHILSCQITFLE